MGNIIGFVGFFQNISLMIIMSLLRSSLSPSLIFSKSSFGTDKEKTQQNFLLGLF